MNTPHSVMVIAFDGVVLSDLAIACETLKQAKQQDGSNAYTVTVCATENRVDADLLSVHCDADLSALANAQTIVVPGLTDIDAQPPAALIGALTLAAVKGVRIASISSGAFILAAAGLLNGLRATTHWRTAPLLASRYPEVDVDPHALFVDNGQILTSAGASAGTDLCLHMIGSDFGADAAVSAAKVSVIPLQREGGQAPYIDPLPQPSPGTPLEPLLTWIEQNLTKPLDVATLCQQSGFSEPTLNDHFAREADMPPTEWIKRCRIRRAQVLLESTDQPMGQIAKEAGFSSLTKLRTQLSDRLGVSPSHYRRLFRRS